MKEKQKLRTLIPWVIIITSTLGLLSAYQYSIKVSNASGLAALRNTVSARLNYIQATSEQFYQINASEYIQQSLSSMAAENDLVLALVSDTENNIIASSRYTQVGQPWNQFLPAKLGEKIKASIRNQRPIIWQQGDHLIGISPICPEKDLKTLQCGFVYYEASLAGYSQNILTLMSGYTLFTLVMLILVTLVTTILVQRLLTIPIDNINTLLRRFANGDRNIHIKNSKTYELGNLSESINFLLQRIIRDEATLIENEEKMRNIVNTVAGAIIMVDENGAIENFNPGAQSLFGYSSAEVIGKNVSILLADTSKDNVDNFLQKYLLDKNKDALDGGRETLAVKKEGTSFPIHFTISETRVRDKRYFTGIVIDLTDHKKITNALTAANRELFTTNLALKESSRTDLMTGLYNRAFFNSNIESEINRATRYKFPACLIMCDIDYFKRYNDFYGHPKGDTCIVEVARAIKQSFSRAGEIAARYGGEEFIIIVPNQAVDEVMERAEHLRQSVQSLELEHQKSDVLPVVTISVGVCCYNPEASTQPPQVRSLIDSADTAMYQSKAEGRNRTSYKPFNGTPETPGSHS